MNNLSMFDSLEVIESRKKAENKSLDERAREIREFKKKLGPDIPNLSRWEKEVGKKTTAKWERRYWGMPYGKFAYLWKKMFGWCIMKAVGLTRIGSSSSGYKRVSW